MLDFGQFDFGQLAEVGNWPKSNRMVHCFLFSSLSFSLSFFSFPFSFSSSFSSDSAFSFCSVSVFCPKNLCPAPPNPLRWTLPPLTLLPPAGPPKISLIFHSLATIFILSFLSWRWFRGICGVIEGRDPQMCTFGVLGLSCETPAATLCSETALGTDFCCIDLVNAVLAPLERPLDLQDQPVFNSTKRKSRWPPPDRTKIWALPTPLRWPPPPDPLRRPKWGFTRQPENSKTFEGPGLQSHHKFHETTPKRGRKNENCGGTGKMSAKFWAPTLRGPALSRPHFLQVWASTLRGPTLWGPTLWGPNFNIKNWPKSKLAEVEIGRSRKKKKSWPKSKLAEVDRARPGLLRSRVEIATAPYQHALSIQTGEEATGVSIDGVGAEIDGDQIMLFVRQLHGRPSTQLWQVVRR